MFHTQKGKKLALKYKLTLYDVMDISNKYVSFNGIQLAIIRIDLGTKTMLILIQLNYNNSLSVEF